MESEAGDVLPPVLRRRLYTLARAIVHDEEEAQDLVQETAVRVLANIGQFEHRSTYFTWVTRIMMHEAFARVRRRRRIQQLDSTSPASYPTPTSQLVARERNPEEQFIDREYQALLTTAMRILPKDHRSIFVLHEVEELDTAEIAARLNISYTCANTRLYRARQLLRERLAGRLGRTGNAGAGSRARRP